jgi:hypothetical protein
MRRWPASGIDGSSSPEKFESGVLPLVAVGRGNLDPFAIEEPPETIPPPE